MQAFFPDDESNVKAFRKTISEARFARYLKESKGDASAAIQLYHWNALLSQAMYLPLQMWEVSLRNKLNEFLIWKYNARWPYDERALRALTREGNRRLDETKDRLDPQRRLVQIPTDAIVADLSAGFWVSLLTARYDVPFVWRYNLARIFPHYSGKPDRPVLAEMCERMLVLRNRVAHHEPIFHLDLPNLKEETENLTKWMCSAASIYAETACTFHAVWSSRPSLLPAPANDPNGEFPLQGE